MANQISSSIQNHIISKLKNARAMKYSELMPENEKGRPAVPNDLFNYHLQFLVKKGFLVREDDGYSLSETGVRHVADPILSDSKVITSLFKVNVITVVSRIHDGKLQIINQLRKSNPSFGKIGIPGGVVLKGEDSLTAAKRKLKVETGLDADGFRLVGMERRMMFVKDELFSDVLFPIAYSTQVSGELRNTEFGENMWVSIDEAIKNDSSDKFDCITAISKVLAAIKDGSIDSMPFFYDEVEKRGEVQP